MSAASPALTLHGRAELVAHAGRELGVSGWHLVTQQDVDRFADVTGDDQWIHVDVERARQTPFGGTIAHGYYTLSLVPMFTYGLFAIEGFAFMVNYGVDKVRFPAPLPVGSKVRMRAELTAVDEVPGGMQASIRCTLEREGGEKPVCVAETLVRLFEEAGS